MWQGDDDWSGIKKEAVTPTAMALQPEKKKTPNEFSTTSIQHASSYETPSPCFCARHDSVRTIVF